MIATSVWTGRNHTARYWLCVWSTKDENGRDYDPTWEPEGNLDCKDCIATYKGSHLDWETEFHQACTDVCGADEAVEIAEELDKAKKKGRKQKATTTTTSTTSTTLLMTASHHSSMNAYG